MTNLFLIKARSVVSLFICLALLSACSTTSNAPLATESVNFGQQPTDYKKIVKAYLNKKSNRAGIDLDKVHFLNQPNKYIFERFSKEEFGYRVCALIPIKDVNKLRSHFFLINNGKVIKHLHDTGLISLSDKFCNIEALSLEKGQEKTIVATSSSDTNGFKYIICQSKSNEIFFAFNPDKQQLIQQNNGEIIAEFNIQQLSETHIVARTTDSQVSINRISGTMLFQFKGIKSKAHCELSSQQRF